MEIYQEYGNDLVVTATGDLLTADGGELTNQRIIRRLLTTPITVINPPDYLDEPTYGAGLPQFVGRPNSPEVEEEINGLVTSQMYLENTVAQNPPPEITITGLPDELNMQIKYTNLLTNQQAVISFSVNG
jgi:hypothetical protein